MTRRRVFSISRSMRNITSRSDAVRPSGGFIDGVNVELVGELLWDLCWCSLCNTACVLRPFAKTLTLR